MNKILNIWNAEKVRGKKSRNIPSEVKEALYSKAKALNTQQFSNKAISKKIGIPEGTVSYWLSGRSNPLNNINMIDLTSRSGLAKIFGFFTVKGYINKINEYDYRIQIQTEKLDLIEEIYDSFKCVFGEEYMDKKYTYDYKNELREQEYKNYVLVMHSKHFVDFWKGYEGMPPFNKRPEYNECIKEYPIDFLTSVFKVAGCFQKGNVINLGSNEKRLKQIGKILDLLDIDYSIFKYEVHTSHSMIIGTKGCNLIKNNIPRMKKVDV